MPEMGSSNVRWESSSKERIIKCRVMSFPKLFAVRLFLDLVTNILMKYDLQNCWELFWMHINSAKYFFADSTWWTAFSSKASSDPARADSTIPSRLLHSWNTPRFQQNQRSDINLKIWTRLGSICNFLFALSFHAPPANLVCLSPSWGDIFLYASKVINLKSKSQILGLCSNT